MASKFDPSAVDIDIEQLKSKTEKPWFRSERFVCCPWKKFNRPNLLDLGKWKFLETNNSCIPDGEVSRFYKSCTYCCHQYFHRLADNKL
jgi:hypothetical protein